MGRRRRRAATEGSVMNGADLADLGHVHIVGIGGAGMSGIASILAARGVHVTGSDAKESRRVQSSAGPGHRGIGRPPEVHNRGHPRPIRQLSRSRILSVGSRESIRSQRCLAPLPWRQS